jgi:hypothetical protein
MREVVIGQMTDDRRQMPSACLVARRMTPRMWHRSLPFNPTTGAEMHDYNIVKAIHQDRMAELEAEADHYRLVRMAKGPRPQRNGLRGVSAMLASAGRMVRAGVGASHRGWWHGRPDPQFEPSVAARPTETL